MINSGVYKITCTENGKIYIGSAKRYSQRVRQHLNTLRLGVHKNAHLQNAFDLYGEGSFLFELIQPIENINDLLAAEQSWLDLTKCYDRKIGFNICYIAGSSLGVKRTDEFKEKIRQANLSRSEEVKSKTISAVKKANTGRPAHNKGVKMWADKPHPKGALGKRFPNREYTEEWYANSCKANKKPRGEKYLKLRSWLSSKTYYFWTPEGCPVKIENMAAFCKIMGLNKSRMYQVARGNEPEYKGWIPDPDCCPELYERIA